MSGHRTEGKKQAATSQKPQMLGGSTGRLQEPSAAATVQVKRGGFFRMPWTSSKPVPEHSGIYKLHLQAQATLNAETVRDSVQLPPGVNELEWIASQLVGILEETSQMVNLIEDLCTYDTCPKMTAGKHWTFSWADETNPTPRSLSAPEYMKTLLTYAYERLGDRKVLPIDGSPIDPGFRGVAATLCKRFFRVYAHTYLSHFDPIRAYGAEAHVNCCFKHFLFFALEFDLITRNDTAPLDTLVRKFTDGSKFAAAA